MATLSTSAEAAAHSSAKSGAKISTTVRIEDETSIGRSYSKKAEVVKGLGAERRKLRTTTWRDAYGVGSTTPSTLESYTLAKIHLSQCTREDLLDYLHNTWDLTTTLFAALADDSVFYMVPDKLRRPLIFYSAHPAALYANKMHLTGLIDHVHPFFQKLFETGVDEMSWDDMDVMQDEDFHWPTIAEVVQFRADVLKAVEDAIKRMPNHPKDAPITQESPYWSLVMGFEHERIHLETSSVLIRQLPASAVIAPPGWRTAPSFALSTPADAPSNDLVHVEDGTASLGKPREFPSFGWDNEYGHRDVHVPSFQASKYLVSNAEFLPFVEAGGYTAKQWWVSDAGDDEGWRWRTYRNASHPSFWVAPAHADFAKYCGGKEDYPYQKDDGNAAVAGTDPKWKLRIQFAVVDMPWDWPVEVNYLEAAAFLRWKAHCENTAAAASGGAASACARVSYRLPTEAEYHMIRGDPAPYPAATAARANAAGYAGNAGASVATSSQAAALLASGAGRLPVAPTPNVGETLPAADASGSVPVVDQHAHGKVLLPNRRSVVGGSDEEEASHQAAGATSAAGSSGWTPAHAEAAKVDIGMQASCPGNVNMRWQSSTPVHFYPPSSSGFHDSHGNVWQWVEDHFAPLPGFEIHYMYDDFSTPCFDGWHTAIMGGSWVSTGELASSFARYHFRRHFFQHLGFRYVKLENSKEAYPGSSTVANLWEGTMSAVSRDVTNNYAKQPEKMPYAAEVVAPEAAINYHQALAGIAAQAVTVNGGALATSNVLHVGCGVGGASFAFVQKGFGRVVAVDACEPSIRTARVFQHHGQLEYERQREGVLTDTTVVRAPVVASDRARVTFLLHTPAAASTVAGVTATGTGSGVNDLSGVFADKDVVEAGPYDAIVIDDQITKQTQPLELLSGLGALLKKPTASGTAGSSASATAGGIVVVSSGNDWDPRVTPRNSWLGGFKMNGEEMTSLHILKYHMRRQGLAFVAAHDIARLTREHGRKFTLQVLETSVYKATVPQATATSTASASGTVATAACVASTVGGGAAGSE